MNHVVTLSSTRALGSVVNKANGYDSRNYVCVRCFRRHALIKHNGRDLSTYIAALRLMLKKKENSTKSNISNQAAVKRLPSVKKLTKRSTEILKVTDNKSTEAKMIIHQIKPSEVKAFAEDPGMTFLQHKYKCIYDSTRSYDPSLLIPRVAVENWAGIFMNELEKGYSTNTSISPNNSNNNYLISSSPNKTEKQINSHQHYGQLKTKIPFNNEQTNTKENVSDVKLDVFKILPLSAVEIFPMPRSLQNNMTKKSAAALEKLTKPDVDISKKYVSNLQPEKLPNLGILIDPSKNEKEIDLENFYEEFKEIHIGRQGMGNFQEDLFSSESAFFQLLQSHIDVSLNNKTLLEALNILSICRNKLIWKDVVKNLNAVDVYNAVLASYSAQGNWKVVSKIIKWMEEDGVSYNTQTYAAVLDCLGRVNKKVFETEDLWRKEVVQVLKDIHNEELSLNGIFTKTTLTKDQYENILQTIRKVLPYFEIPPTKIKLNSDCLLLKDLYKDGSEFQSPVDSVVLNEPIEKLVEEQLLLERNFSIRVKSVSNINKNSSDKNRKRLDELNERWRGTIERGFAQSLKVAQMDHLKNPNKYSLYGYLNCLPPKEFVDVMMQTVQNLVEYSGGYSPNTVLLYKILGEKIHLRYQIKKKCDTNVVDVTGKLFKKYCAWYAEPTGPAMNTRQEWQMLIQDFGDHRQLDTPEIKWPDIVKTALGKYLYNIIFKEVKVVVRKDGKESLIPAFYQVLRYKKSKASEEIKCHPVVKRMFDNVGFEYLNFDVNQMPMVCPPKPWKTVSHGGYLILPTDFIRKPKDRIGRLLNLKKVPTRQLYSTFDSLNSLQAVPWIVNEGVLDVALEIFRNGGCNSLNVPQFPENEQSPLKVTSESTLTERHQEYQRRRKIYMERLNQYGLWCETLYRLSLANHFRKRVFWLPQNFDFRGRVYPVPPHLNHLGADLFRSLLLFAKSKPLGPNGLDWIKIHTINLTGTHKMSSVQERLEYANEILPEILDSAEKPLTGRKWWANSEEPWQTLAACMEIKKALDSPNPELYTTRFPIHQDGSCNGLQHYAALGRDKIGAESVNLACKMKPQDVYSLVTEIIERERAKDAQNGVEIAKVLDGYIKRKVVKQTIMTTVYGVTQYGARHQIAGQLEDIEKFPKEHVWQAAGYLTKKAFQSLKQMFTSAKEIQDWFVQCATLISKKGNSVEWVTPLGLPVMQPYFKKSKNKYHIVIPNVMKQKNAFAPNFVHSLDSSHMMLTSLFCEQAGLTFASIHDCYWTHPNTVDVMNKICREQFVSLHSQSILEDLSNFFIDHYAKDNNYKDAESLLKVFTGVPKRGNFDLNSVIKSVYFFS